MNVTLQPARWVVPEVGTFVQILHDSQTDEWGRESRAKRIGYNATKNPTGSYPDTFYLSGMKPNDFYPLSEQWQWAWFNLLDISIDNWKWLTQHGIAFTDQHAVQNGFTDYVAGINLAAQKPFQVKSLALGGNIVKVIGEDANRWHIEAFDLTQPPPVIDPAEVWRVHVATQSTIINKILPFPQAGGRDVFYFLPSIGGVNKIDKALTRPIENGAIYNPYWLL